MRVEQDNKKCDVKCNGVITFCVHVKSKAAYSNMAWAKAQFKRRAIVLSNVIVFKLDCRTTVDSNVEFNLVVPDSTDSNVEPG